MTRTFFLAFALTLSLADFSFAQKRVELSEPTVFDQTLTWVNPNWISFQNALETLQTKTKFEYRLTEGTDPKILTLCCIRGDYNKVPLSVIIHDMVSKFSTLTAGRGPIRAELNTSTVTIYGPAPVAAPTAPATPAYEPPKVRHPEVGIPREQIYQQQAPVPVQPVIAAPPGAYIQPTIITRRAYDPVLARIAAAEFTGVPAPPLPPSYSYSYGYPNAGPAPSSYVSYSAIDTRIMSPYGFWYVNCQMLPADRDCTHGRLWIDGPSGNRGEKWLQQFDIYVDGNNIGPASKYNQRPNTGRTIETGEHLVQIVRISDDMIVYETNVKIENAYVMKGEYNIIRFDENRVKHGPFRKRIVNPPNSNLEPKRADEVLRRPGGN